LVYTVSPGRAVSVLSGGLALVPEHSLEDVDAGLVPEPDVVVVPAVTNAAGKELAPLRDWITRRAGRGSAHPRRLRRVGVAGRRWPA
jgi:hypothetical protein